MESILRSCTLSRHREYCIRCSYFINFSSKRRISNLLHWRTSKLRTSFSYLQSTITPAQHIHFTILTSHARTYHSNNKYNQTFNLTAATTTPLTSSSSLLEQEQLRRNECEQEKKENRRSYEKWQKQKEEECVYDIHSSFSREIASLVTPTRVLNRLRSLLVQVVLYSAAPLTPAQGIHVVKQVMDSTTREMIACAETSLRVLKCKKGQPWQITKERECSNQEPSSERCYSTNTSANAKSDIREERKVINRHTTEHYDNYVKSLAQCKSPFSSRLLLIGYEFERLYEQSVIQLLPEVSDYVELLHMQNKTLAMEDKQHVHNDKQLVKEEMPSAMLSQQQQLPSPSINLTHISEHNNQHHYCTDHKHANSVNDTQTSLSYKEKQRQNKSTNKFSCDSAMANTITCARPSPYAIADWMLLGLLLTDAQLRISVYGNYICYPVQPSMLLATYDVTAPCNFLTQAYSLSRFTAKMKDQDVHVCDVTNTNNNSDNYNENKDLIVRGNVRESVRTSNAVDVNVNSNITPSHNDWRLDFVEVAPEALHKSFEELSQYFPEDANLLRSHNIKGTSAKYVYNWTLAHSLFFMFEAFVERSSSNSKNVISEKKYEDATQEHKANNNSYNDLHNKTDANKDQFVCTTTKAECANDNEQLPREEEQLYKQIEGEEEEEEPEMEMEPLNKTRVSSTNNNSELATLQPSQMYPLIRCLIANFDQNECDMLGTSRTVKQQNFIPTLPLLSTNMVNHNYSESSSSQTSSSSSESSFANVQCVWIKERAITSSAAKGCNEALNGALSLRNWVGEVVVNNNNSSINNGKVKVIGKDKFNNSGSSCESGKNGNEEMSNLTWTNSIAQDDELSGGTGIFANKLKTIGQRLNWESSSYSTNSILLSKLFKYSVAVPITAARLALLIRWSVSAPFASTYQHCFIYFLLLYAANPSSHRMYLREAKREHSQFQLFKFLQSEQKRELMRELNAYSAVHGASANIKEAVEMSKEADKEQKKVYSQSTINVYNTNDSEEKTSKVKFQKEYKQKHENEHHHHQQNENNPQRAIFRSEISRRVTERSQQMPSVNFKTSANTCSNNNINSGDGKSKEEKVNNDKNARQSDVVNKSEFKKVSATSVAASNEEDEEHESRSDEVNATNYVSMIRNNYMKEYKAFNFAVTMNNECIHLIVFRILPSHRLSKRCNSCKAHTAQKSQQKVKNKHFVREYDAINKCNGKPLYKFIEVLPTITCTPREIITYLQHGTQFVNNLERNDTSSTDNEQSHNSMVHCCGSARENLANEEEYLLVFPLNLSVLKRRIKLVSSALARHRLFCDYYVEKRMRAGEQCESGKESESISKYKVNNAHLYNLTIRDLTQLTLWEHEYGEAMAAEMMTAYLRCFPDSVQLIRPDKDKTSKGKPKKVKSKSDSTALHPTRHIYDNISSNYSSLLVRFL